MGRMARKVALISGGASGQGAAEARLFAKERAGVVVGDVLDEVGMELAAEINRDGGGAVFIHLDVTSAADWQAAVRAAEDGFGRLDVLVNNAGAWRGGRVAETTEDDWDFQVRGERKGRFPGHLSGRPGNAPGRRRLDRERSFDRRNGGGRSGDRPPGRQRGGGDVYQAHRDPSTRALGSGPIRSTRDRLKPICCDRYSEAAKSTPTRRSDDLARPRTSPSRRFIWPATNPRS